VCVLTLARGRLSVLQAQWCEQCLRSRLAPLHHHWERLVERWFLADVFHIRILAHRKRKSQQPQRVEQRQFAHLGFQVGLITSGRIAAVTGSASCQLLSVLTNSDNHLSACHSFNCLTHLCRRSGTPEPGRGHRTHDPCLLWSPYGI